MSRELSEKAKAIVVTNHAGNTLFESQGTFNDGILVSKLPVGIYFIHVRLADQSVRTLKMIVER